MKKILLPILALVLALGLALPMATPVFASQITLIKEVTPATPNIYYVGDTITYECTVQNPPGNSATNTYSVIEDILPNGSTVTLATNVVQTPGQSNTYYATYVVALADINPVTKRVTNLLHATGTDSTQDTIDATTQKTSLIIQPDIDIEKTVDCNDDGEFLDTDYGYAGDMGHWRIVVTNTGDSPLTNAMVTDTNLHDFGAPFDLAIGEVVQFDYDQQVNVDTINEATVVADDAIGGTVTDTDAATNLVISPDIMIEKTVDCNDDGIFLDEDTGTAGDTGHWRIVVTNTGDSPLDPVVLTDSNGFAPAQFALAPGQFVQFDYDTIVLTTTTNVAVVVGTDVLGNTVTATDDATNIIVGGQGCTPGYWKNNAINWEHVSWYDYSPDDLFSDVFDRDITVKVDKVMVTDPTLLQALSAQGGDINALARHAVAALLNASNPNVSYPDGVAGIIAATQAAIDDGSKQVITAQKDQFDEWNNLGCSIDMHGNPIIIDGDETDG